MTHVSKRRLNKKTYEHVLDTLDLVLGKLKKDEVRSFLFSLMSGTERLMVAKRFAAITLLQQGRDDKSIAETLKMTRSTVNKLEMIMKIKDKGFLLAFKKIYKEKMAKEINELFLGLGKGAAGVFYNWRVKPPNDYPRKH